MFIKRNLTLLEGKVGEGRKKVFVPYPAIGFHTVSADLRPSFTKIFFREKYPGMYLELSLIALFKSAK
jgi:hypothetical protein